MVRAFLPELLTQKEAMIVNVSSGLAFIPLTISPVYSATKAAIHAYRKSLIIKLRKANVRIVELAPPGTETPLFWGEFKKEMERQKAISVDVLEHKAIAGTETCKTDFRPGLSNVLYAISRLAPSLMLKKLPSQAISLASQQMRRARNAAHRRTAPLCGGCGRDDWPWRLPRDSRPPR